MTVEIISVGTEILLGTIVNKNAAFLAAKCAGLGLNCYYQTVVGDNSDRLKEVLKTAVKRADIVMFTGGMGSAEDDITKQTVADFCKKELHEDEQCKKRIEEYYFNRGKKPSEKKFRQAFVPQDAVIMHNRISTAPGLIMETSDAKLLLFPGDPEAVAAMFEEFAAPYISRLTPGAIETQTVKLCGVMEDEAEAKIKDLIDGQDNPTIATCVKEDEIQIRVTASGKNQKEAQKLIKPIVKELKVRFGYDIYSTEENSSLEKAVVELLKSNNLTVTCAESCTGGMLSSRIIDVPGASDIYKIGIVTYSNKAKRKFLGVKKATLQKYGAVSEQTAKEMAKGAAANYKADVAIAVTGIAGPDGGTAEKPVGLVYIGCCIMGEVTVRKFYFKGNRTQIRQASTVSALMLMRKCVLEYISKVTFGEKS